MRPRKNLLTPGAGKGNIFVHDCIHEHLPTDNLHTCIPTLAGVYGEPSHNASVCLRIHVYMCAEGPATVLFHTPLPLKKASDAPQRQGNWVESMSLSYHLMALPAPLLALLSQGTHTTYIPTSYPLQPFWGFHWGPAPGTHMCKVEAPSARRIHGETSELRAHSW